MKVQMISAYLVRITTRANNTASRLLHYSTLLYRYQLTEMPYRLSRLVIMTSKSYQSDDYIEAMADAAILDYNTKHLTEWLNRKRGFHGHVSYASNY